MNTNDSKIVNTQTLETEEKKNVDMAQAAHTIDGFKHIKFDFSTLKMDVKPYYPMDIVFEMMIPKEMLKKNLGLKKVHHLIGSMAESGLITRQEIVSMLPPLLLDVQAHHAVFDMCAAPGSKTAQIAEMIMSDHM
jgi:16S rRNA C967 or C1407 C5-methylase (RsmB/RsmF family)